MQGWYRQMPEQMLCLKTTEQAPGTTVHLNFHHEVQRRSECTRCLLLSLFEESEEAARPSSSEMHHVSLLLVYKLAVDQGSTLHMLDRISHSG